jgi:phosphopentomutase
MPDAASFLDEGTNTLANTARAVGGLTLPNLAKLGLGNITPILGVPEQPAATASWGRMSEQSPAKDTVIGHWELAGLPSSAPFATYPDGFPPAIIEAFEQESGFRSMFNKPASGTVVIEQCGPEHMATGRLIVYTSADSVFQVAAHEDVVSVPRLHAACEAALRVVAPYRVARVIARPFVGAPGSFKRTYNRKDFCMPPPSATLLTELSDRGLPVHGVGKIEDIFAGRGVSDSVHTEGNRDGLEHTLRLARTAPSGLTFVNLVDFDMLYGHRRNPEGYARALEEVDAFLPSLLAEMKPGDSLVLTADHGCDPTHGRHTDHTREYVPVLYFRPGAPGRPLGTRPSFADVAATLARDLGIPYRLSGTAF